MRPGRGGEGARSPVFTSAASDCCLPSFLSLWGCFPLSESRRPSCPHLPLCVLRGFFYFFKKILISKKDPRSWASSVPPAHPPRPPLTPLLLRIVKPPAPLTQPARLPRLLPARTAGQLQPWLGYCCRLCGRCSAAAAAAAATACCSARAACSQRSAPARRLLSCYGRRGARSVESASPGPASRTLTVPVSRGGGGGDPAGTVRGGSAGSGQPSEVMRGSRPRGGPCVSG